MLRVFTKLAASQVHGIGLFAAQFIPKGTVTWIYDSEFDQAYSEAEFLQMPDTARKEFLPYLYFDNELQKFVLPNDALRFINHSKDNPNISASPRQDIAARDIFENEELLCDYDCYDVAVLNRLGIS